MRRRAKKRVEDIDHRQFHSFLVEPPQGRTSRSSGTSSSSEAAGDVDASDGGGDLQQDLPENNQKKRGIDWSQKLRERNRRKIWRQFRLN